MPNATARPDEDSLRGAAVSVHHREQHHAKICSHKLRLATGQGRRAQGAHRALQQVGAEEHKDGADTSAIDDVSSPVGVAVDVDALAL
eukprot:6776-Pyramimonas_sp.AAC.1